MAEKKYTVTVPAPKGHSGSIPVQITSKEAGEIKMDVPYDEPTPVPLPVARLLKDQFEGVKVDPELPDPRKKDTKVQEPEE